MSGGEERSQKATPQKMKEVRKKGQLGRSRDLSGWLALAAGATLLPSQTTRTREVVEAQLREVAVVAADPSPSRVAGLLSDGLGQVLGLLAPFFAVMFIVVVVTQVAQGKVYPRFRLKKEVFQPNKGIKRLFGKQTLWEAVKTLAKSVAVGLVVFAALQAALPTLMGSGRLPLVAVLNIAGSSVMSLVQAGIVAGLALAFVDLAVTMKRNRKQTRMTLKEVKDENKRTEGDPHIKGAIRSKQRAMSRNRMMAAVADADVVVVNPTHYAVALRYEPGAGAPKVVAKGVDLLAAKIRERAADNRVPTVCDVTLARALYAAVEVDQEIPDYLFVAVARVLAFVMSLRRRGAASGEHHSPGGTALPEYVGADHAKVAREQARAARAARRRPGPTGPAVTVTTATATAVTVRSVEDR
ncbi:MAG: EscU/YscU/HrcU family type III secretion system export apparatus switch protein [Micrococcales bacterium]|nr:EscU/YscU/HrcU family type III secretion system export apparatus switch protein [Micrococcales bacterium]